MISQEIILVQKHAFFSRLENNGPKIDGSPFHRRIAVLVHEKQEKAKRAKSEHSVGVLC